MVIRPAAGSGLITQSTARESRAETQLALTSLQIIRYFACGVLLFRLPLSAYRTPLGLAFSPVWGLQYTGSTTTLRSRTGALPRFCPALNSRGSDRPERAPSPRCALRVLSPRLSTRGMSTPAQPKPAIPLGCES